MLLVALGGAVVLDLHSRTAVRPGQEHLVNRPGFIAEHNSPTLVRNPRRAANLVVAHRIDRPAFSAELDWSADGGGTWQPSDLPLPAGLDRPFAPDAAFGPDGRLYVLYVNLTGVGNTPQNLWLATSTDGGRSISAPTWVAGGLTFQPRLAIGPDGTVFIIWLQAGKVGLLRLASGDNPVVEVHSVDGGDTFSAPVRVSDPLRPRVGAASPVVDSRGRLVVLYEDFRGDARDFANLDGPPWDQPFALVVTRSDDRGRSFAAGVVVDPDVVATERFLVFLPPFPSIAAGGGGRLYVSWSDGRNGDPDVLLRRSDDSGLHWSDPVRVNDNPRGDGTSQYLPRVAVAPNGRVDVVFLDRRRDRRNNLVDATLASSADGGRTFGNLRLTRQSFDAAIGSPPGPGLGVDFGSRLGLVSGNGGSFAVWTDTRLGSDATGRQDIFGTAITGAGAPVSRVAIASAATVIGLAIVGWMWRSRGNATRTLDGTRPPH